MCPFPGINCVFESFVLLGPVSLLQQLNLVEVPLLAQVYIFHSYKYCMGGREKRVLFSEQDLLLILLNDSPPFIFWLRKFQCRFLLLNSTNVKYFHI